MDAQRDPQPYKSPYADPLSAAVYARISAPLQFDRPARDLVEILNPARNALVLDVGTGTGAVGRPTADAIGSDGLVIGVDLSIEMLRFARDSRRYPVAAAQIPGLPFRADTFDAVTAGFVVSHFRDYATGLADLRRVCRVGGRVAMSSWGTLANVAARLWNDIAATFVSREHLDEAFRAHIPWDGHFSDRQNVQRALEDAGLTSVLVDTRDYQISMPTADFLASREASMQGMLLRQKLSVDGWRAFDHRVADAFRHEFSDVVTYVRDVLFAVGTKPRGPGAERT
jgi:ubiquinone/menaquinone biosynthesis C-methylase UbiE